MTKRGFRQVFALAVMLVLASALMVSPSAAVPTLTDNASAPAESAPAFVQHDVIPVGGEVWFVGGVDPSGRYITLYRGDGTSTRAYRLDWRRGELLDLSITTPGLALGSFVSEISDDGRRVLMQLFGATGSYGIVIRDVVTGAVERADVPTGPQDGRLGPPTWSTRDIRHARSMDGSGTRVIFFSDESRFGDGGTNRLWLRDLRTSTTTAVAQGVQSATISVDGRWVAFLSTSQVLPNVPVRSDGGARLYERQLDTGIINLVSPLDDTRSYVNVSSHSGDSGKVGYTRQAASPFPAPVFDTVIWDRATGARHEQEGTWLNAPILSADGSSVTYNGAGYLGAHGTEILNARFASPVEASSIELPLPGSGAAMSADGRTVVLGDGNGHRVLVVEMSAPPSGFTSPAFADAIDGTPFSFTVATESPGAVAIQRSGRLPTGMTFVDNGDGTGVLAGTPQTRFGGAFTLNLTARFASGAIARQQFTLNVLRSPQVRVAARTVARVGSATEVPVTVKGFPLPAIRISGLPDGLQLEQDPSGAFAVRGVPEIGTGGIHQGVVTASNPQGSASAAMTIRLLEAPALLLDSPIVELFAGQRYAMVLPRVGFPAPTFTISGTLPPGITLSRNGVLRGTAPAAAVDNLYEVTIRATNSEGNSDASLTIRVRAPGPPG